MTNDFEQLAELGRTMQAKRDRQREEDGIMVLYDEYRIGYMSRLAPSKRETAQVKTVRVGANVNIGSKVMLREAERSR